MLNTANMYLNDKNFLIYAMKNYNNPHCQDIEEFNEDLASIIHLKKLFTRYSVGGVLKDRLITNHLISLFNVFSPIAAIHILFFKIDSIHHVCLKTFLVYLNRCPEMLYGDIKIDKQLLDKLVSENKNVKINKR